MRQGQLSEAIAASQQALKIQPNFAAAYKTLDNAVQGLGRMQAAADCYAKALQIQPNFPEVYANLDSLYAQQQQWQPASAYYQKAIEFKPNFVGAYRNLAKVLTQLGQPEKANYAWYRAVAIETSQAPEPTQSVPSKPASKDIFISFKAELWPCCWVSHTKYAVYNDNYRPQMLALLEKYGEGFNSY